MVWIKCFRMDRIGRTRTMKRMVIIFMDCGAQCWGDIFIECLSQSYDYEVIYLHKLYDGIKAERVIGA